jgi:hypothetical protein
LAQRSRQEEIAVAADPERPLTDQETRAFAAKLRSFSDQLAPRERQFLYEILAHAAPEGIDVQAYTYGQEGFPSYLQALNLSYSEPQASPLGSVTVRE